MKLSLFLLAMVTVSLSKADIPAERLFQPGNYVSKNGCELTIDLSRFESGGKILNWMTIHAYYPHKSGDMTLRLQKNNGDDSYSVFSLGSCYSEAANSTDGTVAKGSGAKITALSINNETDISATCGGPKKAWDNRVVLRLVNSTFVGISSQGSYAKYGLSNGWSWGPQIDSGLSVSCDEFHRVDSFPKLN